MRGDRVVLGLALLVAAASMFLSALLFTRVDSTTTRTNKTLCTFRADVEQRVTATEKFLAEHPNGIPGIPGGTLRQSLSGQRRTVEALSGLPCP